MADLERHYEINILRYVTNHPGEYLLIIHFGGVDIEEKFFKTEEERKNEMEKHKDVKVCIKKIPNSLENSI